MNIMGIAFNTHESVDKSMRQRRTLARQAAALFVVAMLLATILASPQKAAADQVIITPNAAGTLTGCTWSGGFADFTNLADDLDTTTASCTAGTTDVVTVNLTNTGLAANDMIKQVTINILGYGAAAKEYMIYSTGLPGGPYTGPIIALAIAPASSYSYTIVNPGGANNFTPAAVDGMTAGIDANDNGDKWLEELYAVVEYWPQGVDEFLDISADSYTPATAPPVPVAKVTMNGNAGNATNGYTLTSTLVRVTGTLSPLGNVRVWWNTADSFTGATAIGTAACSLNVDCNITGISSGGTTKGYLFYSIDLPSQSAGTYSLTVKDVKANSALVSDRIGLPKSTASRSVLLPNQSLEDWKDNAKNYNLNQAAPFNDLYLAKIETKKSSEGKPLNIAKVKVEGTISNISNIKVWWKPITDDFATASVVGTQNSPAINTVYNINLTGAGLNPGFLYFTVSAPSGARGSFRATVNEITNVSADNIPLPKSTSYTYITNPYAIQVCGDCHAYPPKDGTRSGTTGAVQGTHSTHARFNPMKCRACHKDTTSNETNMAHRNEKIQLKSTLGKGGSYSGYTTWNQASSPTMRQCTSVICHNGIAQTWGSGATMTCPQCHYSNSDVDDFTFDYFTSAAIPKIYTTEWKNRGHGKSSGTYDRTGNNPAKLACTNCHDDGIGHGDPVKPYKTKGTGNQDVFCLNCHGSTADRGSLFLPYTAKVRDIRTHSQGVFSSVGYANITTWRIYQIKCIDCHDPHGDDNISMIHKKPWTGGSDQKGRPAAFYNGYSTVRFKKYTGTDGMGKTDGTKFYVCEVCHTRTKFHKQGGTGTSHFDGIKCPDCHQHNMGWAPFKGCTDCHAVARPYLYGVRQITGPGGDFVKLSRHVSNGTANEIVTNYDCIVCHREGDYTKANAGNGFTSDTLHWDGTTSTTRMVNLRNVDSRDTGWSWNKNVKTEAMRTDLDNFCMACHDTDGASNIAVNATDNGLDLAPTGDIATKPFNSNDNLRNGRDGLATRTRIVDVKGQFYGGTGGKSTGYNGNPSQHAVIQGRYSANNAGWTPATWVNHTLRNATVQNTVREKGRLHCSDCHLSETNAHGAANAWHMLLNGTANDFTTDSAMAGLYPATTASIVCYKCHASGVYSDTAAAGSRFTHNQEGRVWSTGDYGGVADNGAKLGPACLICHAGDGFGRIHGRGSATDGDNGQYVANGVTFTKYRFQPGGYYWYAPGATGDNDWNATGAGTCYLVKSSWVGCAQHAGAKAAANNNYARPVKY